MQSDRGLDCLQCLLPVRSLLFAACGHPEEPVKKTDKRKKGVNIPVLEECPFSARFDFPNSLYGLDRCLDQFSVISHWHISTFLEVDCRVLESGCIKS